MTDLLLVAAWLAVLVAGLGVCVALHRLGLATTYVRDLLHVGAGVWVLGWPLWRTPLVPIAITTAAMVAICALPLVSARLPLAARLQSSISDEDERWTGIALYTVAFAWMTPLGLLRTPFPAAAALLALSLGDGIGGAVGRRFGAHTYRFAGAKQKSFEGSAAVAVGAALAIVVAARLFGVAPGALLVAGTALVAALAEALSPRATDNLFVPAIVWLLLSLGGAPGA